MSTRPPEEDRAARARHARQVISGSDLRSSPSLSGVYTAGGGLLTQSQRTYLIAVAVLLVLGVILWLLFSMGVASIIFFLLALTLIAGWLVF